MARSRLLVFIGSDRRMAVELKEDDEFTVQKNGRFTRVLLNSDVLFNWSDNVKLSLEHFTKRKGKWVPNV